MPGILERIETRLAAIEELLTEQTALVQERQSPASVSKAVSINEACARLSLSRTKVFELRRAGILREVSLDGKPMIPVSAIDALLGERRTA